MLRKLFKVYHNNAMDLSKVTTYENFVLPKIRYQTLSSCCVSDAHFLAFSTAVALELTYLDLGQHL